MNTQNFEPQIAREDILDLTGSVVDYTTGNQEIADCNKYLKVNGNPVKDVSTPIDTIKYDAFQPLHDSARKLHITGHYYTGLKIHFGVDSSLDKIRVFYQPVCMDNGKDIGAKLRQYTVIEGGWYAYDSGKNIFISKNHGDAFPFLKNHKEKIGILRMDNSSTHSRFIPSVDVEAVIFPFQKINLLISENPQGTHIALFNSIRKEGISDTPIKHTILLQAINSNPQTANRNAAPAAAPGSYGNLANLCPPNGASVTNTVQ